MAWHKKAEWQNKLKNIKHALSDSMLCYERANMSYNNNLHKMSNVCTINLI